VGSSGLGKAVPAQAFPAATSPAGATGDRTSGAVYPRHAGAPEAATTAGHGATRGDPQQWLELEMKRVRRQKSGGSTRGFVKISQRYFCCSCLVVKGSLFSSSVDATTHASDVLSLFRI